MTSRYTVKEKATSLKAWQLEKEDSAFAPADVWSNADMEPVPTSMQTWTTLTFAAYWFSDLINPGSWSQISSFVSLGLAWWSGVLAVFVGAVVLSVIVVLNGIIGARLHTPFAVTSRAAFGFYGSRFAVVSRMVIAWFWFSINTYQGGTGITICLRAIWPSYNNLPNHLPASSGLTSQTMLSFFLFWLIQLPFTFIHPSKLRVLFLIKGTTVPIVALGMMGWSIHKAGNQASAVMKASNTVSGKEGYWAFMTAVNACISSWSTLGCNIGDFSRYSKKPSSAAAQLFLIPLLYTTASLFGAISSNMVYAIYGKNLWQPFDIIEYWLDNKGGRAAAFFCSLTWAMANMTTNITANSISSANDLTTLFPRWVNIFRGQMVAVTVGVWAFAPWKVLASAGSFINFMGSYAIVLAPIATILTVDYYVVRKSKINVPELYDPHGIYRYAGGFNWRSLLALALAIAPGMPGMINALNSSITIGGDRYYYAMACIAGGSISAFFHILFNKLFPAREALIEEAVLAADVWAGLVPQYAHMALHSSSTPAHHGSVDEKEKDGNNLSGVVEV